MKALHLFQRSGVQYWRRRLPRRVAAVAGRSHACRSLQTRDPRVARRRALALDLAFEEAMQDCETRLDTDRKLTQQEVAAVLRSVYESVLGSCETWAAIRPPMIDHREYESDEEMWQDVDKLSDEFNAPLNQADYWRGELELNLYEEVAPLLTEALAEQGLTLAPDSHAFKRLARKALWAGICAFRDFARTPRPNAPDLSLVRAEALLPQPPAPTAPETSPPEPAAPPAPAHASAAPDATGASQPAPTLAEAFDGYIREKSAGDWGSKSARDADTTRRLALQYFGDVPLTSIDRQRAKEFWQDISSLPRDHGKGKYAGMSFQEAVAEADALDAAQDDDERREPRLGLKTVNKHMTYLRGAFAYVADTFDTDLGKNPFDGLHYGRKALARLASEERLAWSDSEVSALLATPVWQGCAGPHRRAVPGDHVLRDARYWVPLLGLFAGLRLEEACQLRVEDIDCVDGVDCIVVRRGRGRTIKSPAAARAVPIHPVLRRKGFLDHVDAQRAAGRPRLFPELERGGPHALFGYRFTKWFTEYRRQVGLYEPAKDFQSFRHSFDTNLIRKGVPSLAVSALLGHASSGLTEGRYFKGFEGHQLQEYLQQLDYGWR